MSAAEWWNTMNSIWHPTFWWWGRFCVLEDGPDE